MSATCKGCGAPIVWAVTSEGKRIPVDVRPPVYAVTEEPDGSVRAVRVAREGVKFGVSHFATCPKASDFSKGGKKKPDGTND